MKITAQLAGACGNGIDCDGIYDTDGGDVIVRGRFLTEQERADLGLTLPEHEGLLLLERNVLRKAAD